MKLYPKSFKLTQPTIIERKRFYQVHCEMSLVSSGHFPILDSPGRGGGDEIPIRGFQTKRRRGYRKKKYKEDSSQ